mmetsp:Transcript_15742/g.54853  ORF Transcript_15742/g.54853 Transcript_15742/m.54853 type:complete len:147 (-) Transcript_15742:267-707(-)|eukprot:CAMPEP_0203917484 /NCGR_PEP_ID=MMETSP0359-20131031/58103_1 /ASSEMBLY_ACC=CAM_ASM_000338 /TAXON_ID=268821 /ORGANISM="Scrippsiella Hangoei, Strain SHTV-5" /LENGTH=146 /DNA_ID=CAMNT_0050844399 /DNA_START=22 /DNA_END=462 /DNA_ORIENTATION=-
MVSQSHDDKMCSATGAPELSSVKALATARPLRRRRAGPAVPSDAWARGGESEADVPGATPWGLDLGAPLQDWELTELAQRVRFNGALFGYESGLDDCVPAEVDMLEEWEGWPKESLRFEGMALSPLKQVHVLDRGACARLLGESAQ